MCSCFLVQAPVPFFIFLSFPVCFECGSNWFNLSLIIILFIVPTTLPSVSPFTLSVTPSVSPTVRPSSGKLVRHDLFVIFNRHVFI